MNVIRLGLLLCILALASVQGAEFEDTNIATIEDLTEQTLDGKVYFIKFYAPWCGHCKRLAPAWKELAGVLADNPNIVIAHVDCTTHKAVCTEAEVRGYPTLKVYFKGEAVKAYRGARDLDALKDFIESESEALLSESSDEESADTTETA